MTQRGQGMSEYITAIAAVAHSPIGLPGKRAIAAVLPPP